MKLLRIKSKADLLNGHQSHILLEKRIIYRISRGRRTGYDKIAKSVLREWMFEAFDAKECHSLIIDFIFNTL